MPSVFQEAALRSSVKQHGRLHPDCGGTLTVPGHRRYNEGIISCTPGPKVLMELGKHPLLSNDDGKE